MAKRSAGTSPGTPPPAGKRPPAAPGEVSSPADDTAAPVEDAGLQTPEAAAGAVPDPAIPSDGASSETPVPDMSTPASRPAATASAPPERENRWGGGFIPLQPPSAPAVPMPMPEGVLHSADNRLDAVPFEFADIRALAQRILKRAQEQGQQKLDAARKQIAAMEKEAHDKGYKEAFDKGHEAGLAKGLKDGMAEAEKKIAAAIASEKESLRQNASPVSATLKELADAITASRARLQAQTEGDLLLLAIDLAKRLVGHELSVDVEAIKPLALECIGLVTERTGITARVNPEDHRVMEEYYPDLKIAFPDLGPVQVLPDPTVQRGGIHVATREAEVDMRLATRLAAFEEVILGFSGDDAVAPWSQIPPEAIAAAKQANATSPYSLPPGSAEAGGQQFTRGEEQDAEPAGTHQDSTDEPGNNAPPLSEDGAANHQEGHEEAVPAIEEETQPQPADSPEPSPDAAAPAMEQPADPSPGQVEEDDDLAELVDLAGMVDLEENISSGDGAEETA